MRTTDRPRRFKGDGKVEGNLLHGWSGSSTYQAWNGMQQRCENPKSRVFKHYGGRGITMDPEWKMFLNFLRDMGPRPVGLELDRIDNNKGYSKDNCRWTTREKQIENRRTTIYVDLEGEKVCLAEACRRLGVKRHTIYLRMEKGLDFHSAVNKQVRPKNRLTVEKVREIRRLVPVIGLAGTARHLGIHPATTRDAYVGRYWGNK